MPSEVDRVPVSLARPPPLLAAEFPLTVQLVRVDVLVVSHGEHAAAVIAGGVIADGGVGQRGRAVVGAEKTAAARGEVSADGAVGQRRRTVIICTAVIVVCAAGEHAAATGRGVSADGAVGKADRAALVAQSAAGAGAAAGDRQTRQLCRPVVDEEHPARVVAADRQQARPRSGDGGGGRVGQLELAIDKGDHLRRGEDGGVKVDRVGDPRVGIRLADLIAQGSGAAVVRDARDGERRKQPAAPRASPGPAAAGTTPCGSGRANGSRRG